VTTLRMQKRNVLEYLTAACEARLLGQQAPSLPAACPTCASELPRPVIFGR
jgi:hypothetical protein